MELTSSHKLFKIRAFTALASLLLSAFAYYSNDIINNDGILYMNMAEAYAKGGLAEMMEYTSFNWPFFPILVAYIHQLTTFSFESSAYILNALLFVLLLDSLILISKKFQLDSQQLAVAAILFICFQSFNEYRDFIIRDFGYWAFCALTLYRFIQFIEKPTIANATFWQIAAITAVLFRVEGIAILLGLPFYLFINYTPKAALKQYLKLNYLLILGVAIAATLAIEMSGVTAAFSKITTVTNYINPDVILERFNQKATIIETQVLNQHSVKYSAFILSSGLMFMLFYKVIKAMSLGYLGLYLFSWYKNPKIQAAPYRGLIIYFAALNIIILLAFLFHEYFMSRRYAMVTLISLLLLMLPRLTDTIAKAWTSRSKWLLSIIGLILLIGLVDGITQSRSKAYIKETAIWASQNLPENSTVITDDKIIQYYYQSHQPKATLSKVWVGSYHNDAYQNSFNQIIKDYLNYDYLIVVEKRKNKKIRPILASMKLEQIYSQETKRHNKASVYKILTD
ncbi:hypothetical protein A9Q79_00330 [Methylophaga sp. 42_25_T18]|nr:hypothetical protein A9Q79_00330 [Methylophaga sp. 42_25_T18]OUR88910.1 hypothetical protein A9Q92_01925 [Methylophaga sp. 42_8_T64]